MKKTLITLLTVVSCLFANSANETLNVYKLATAPKVDGVFTDWGSKWIDMSKTDATSSTTGCTGQYQIGYTNDSLYIAVKVQDATEFTYDAAVASYFRDCIEAFIHMDTVTILGTNGSDQYRMQRVSDAAAAFEPSTIPANVVSVDSPTGYTQEWAIAWTDIAGRESFDISNGIDALPIPYIRFDIKAADNTDGTSAGRTQQIFWSTDTDNEYPNMTNMGTLHLMGTTAGVSKVAANSSDVYYSAGNDALTVLNYTGEVSIYNVVGKLALQTRVNSSKDLINLSSLNKGVYLVSGSGLSAKFIK
jgi:hypothetical protein